MSTKLKIGTTITPQRSVKRSKTLKLVWSLAVLFLVGRSGVSQTAGALAGTISDASKAVISNATVSAKQQATGETKALTTNTNGIYRFAVLAPGRYDVTVTAPGFQPVNTQITIAVTETSALDITMAPEGVAQEVVVSSSETSLLQTDSSALGRVVDQQTIQAIPLATRNFTQLLVFSPGTSAPLNDATALGRGTQTINSSGQRSVSNSLTIDGIDAVNIHTNSLVENAYSSNGSMIPSPETVQEFKVQTGLYDAQYGRNAGANVNLVTRTGTSTLHGTLFEFFRNEALNANSYFLKRNGVNRPILRQNQFGGTVGGPLYFKNTFFFIGYQGTRQTNGYAGSATVTMPQLGSDRSARTLGALFGGKAGSRGGLAVATDGSNISPVALALLNYRMHDGSYLVPSPQTAQTTGNYSVSIPATFKEDQGSVNLTHKFGANNNLSVRGFLANQPQTNPLGQANVPGFGMTQNFKGRLLSFDDVHIFHGGALVNEARAGFMRIRGIDSLASTLNISDFGMNRFNSSYRTRLPQIAVSGSFSLGYGTDADQGGTQNTFQYSDFLSAVRGRHSFRFGGEVRRYQDNYYTNNRNLGTISLLSFPDFLLGRAGGSIASGGNGTVYSNLNNSSVSSNIGSRNDRLTDYNLFVEDDWKLTPDLTLNIGVRWDRFGSGVDQGGRNGNFVPALYSAPPAGGSTTAGFVQSSNARTLLPGIPAVNPRLLNHELWKNFAPRLGFAYRVNQRLAVRGGYGIFFDRLSNQLGLRTALAPPNYVLSNNSGTANVASTLTDPFPTLPLPSQLPTAPLLYAPPYTSTRQALATNAIDPNITSPYSHQFALNAQWEAVPSLMLELGYVGSTGIHLPTQELINQASLASTATPINGYTTNTAANAVYRVPFLGMSPSGLTYLYSNASASYDSLQMSATKRMSHALQFLASYTYSKSLDNNSGGVSSVFITSSGDQRNLGQAYGPSDFDRTHRFVINYVYQVPYWGLGLARNGLTRTIFADWQLSGVTTWQSGLPFTITDANGGALYGATTSRASFATGASASSAKKSGSTQDRLNAYFDPTAFVTAGDYFGNTNRNLLRGPRQSDWDLSVVKNFSIGGERRLEWRSEFFNLFNHTAFGLPASAVSTPSTFGSITSTVGNPRIVQFAAKVLF